MSDMLAGLGKGHHGGGEEKRLQAEELAVFFLNLIGNEIVQKEQGICLSILEQRTNMIKQFVSGATRPMES